MATVYLAEDTTLHRRVALKRVHPHLLADRRALRRFENEARAASGLTHENIVTVHDYGREGDTPFLVMEYVEGESLDRIIASRGALPNLVLLDIASQILAALGEAHRRGVYHRDVKPANIMIDAAGTAKLMDFGIAHVVNRESVTLTGTFAGSPAYISPEQAEGRQLSARTDVFSVGSVCYQCATGTRPFSGDNPHAVIRAICTSSPVPACRVNPDVLFFVSEFIQRCLSRDCEARPHAPQAREEIEDACRALKLPLKRERTARFLRDPAAYREEEGRSIREALRRAASEARDAGKPATAVGCLNQLSAFGALSARDRRLLSLLKTRAVWGRAGLITGGVGAAILLVCAILFTVENKASFEQPRQEGTETAVESSTEDSAVDEGVSKGVARVTDQHGESLPPVLQAEDGRRMTSAPSTEARVTEVRTVPGASGTGTDTAETLGESRIDSGHGYLMVRSNPPWATIRIDQIEVGQTPRNDPLVLQAGRHIIVLEKPRFTPFRDTIALSPGDTMVRSVRLTRPMNQGASPERRKGGALR